MELMKMPLELHVEAAGCQFRTNDHQHCQLAEAASLVRRVEAPVDALAGELWCSPLRRRVPCGSPLVATLVTLGPPLWPLAGAVYRGLFAWDAGPPSWVAVLVLGYPPNPHCRVHLTGP